jgi:hypothetical protein
MLHRSGLKGITRFGLNVSQLLRILHLYSLLSLVFKSLFEVLYGMKPILHNNLKVFGEVGVVTTKDKIQSNLTSCGTPCIFVVYAENHSKDVNRILNLEINTEIIPQDIIWLKNMHKDWLKNKLMTIIEGEKTVELPTSNERKNR